METRQMSEDESKDAFFRELATIAEAMVERHGREFAMGALVLSARWIAENRLADPARPTVSDEGRPAAPS